jgi:hypothetical protein
MRTNKSAVVGRIQSETRLKGVAGSIAELTGLDKALAKAEEQVYDSAVGIVDSTELDKAVRQVIESAFTTLKADLARKQWKTHLGIRNGFGNTSEEDDIHYKGR